MKLADTLRLGVNTRALAEVAGVTERQIRRMRTDPNRMIPDIDIPDVKVQFLIEQSEYATAKDKARDAWYAADMAYYKILTEQRSFWERVCVAKQFDAAAKHELFKQVDLKIKAAANAVSRIAVAAQKAGVGPIWDTNAKRKKHLLQYFDEIRCSLQTPSEEMLSRVDRNVKRDVA